MRTLAKKGIGILGSLLLMLSGSALAGTLVINSDASDPAPKKAWAEVIEKFEETYPDIEVKYNLYDHEATKPPSVTGW